MQKLGLAIVAGVMGLMPSMLGLQKVSSGESQVILVRVSPREFVVNPARLRPGTVKVLVENRTPLSTTSVTFQLQGASTAKTSVNSTGTKSKSSRWQDVVLQAGTYVVTLDQVPSVKTTVTVEAAK